MRGLILFLCVALLVVGADNLITKSMAVAPVEQAVLAPPVIDLGSPIGISVADCATCPNQGLCAYNVSQPAEETQAAEQGEARQGGPLRRVARAKPARRVLGLVGRLFCRRR